MIFHEHRNFNHCCKSLKNLDGLQKKIILFAVMEFRFPHCKFNMLERKLTNNFLFLLSSRHPQKKNACVKKSIKHSLW